MAADRRRRLHSRSHPGSGTPLLALAQADGATFGYQFNEGSGNLINFMGDPTYDLTVPGAGVTRQIASPVGPDRLGYHLAGGGTCIQGLRPSENGVTTRTFEAVLKYGTPVDNAMVLDAEWNGVRQQFGIQNKPTAATQGNMGYLSAAGGNTSDFGDGSDLGRWHHLVWYNDGSHSVTYLDGVLVSNNSFSTSTNDGAGASCLLAIGGLYGGASQDTYWAFFAEYQDVVLTPAQITAHAAASGCPAA